MAAARRRGEMGREVRGSDPPLISGKGARKEGCHGGGRQRAAVIMVAALQGAAAAGVRGKREREARRSFSPHYLG